MSVCMRACAEKQREREGDGRTEQVRVPPPPEPSWVLVKATLVSRSFTFSTGWNKAVGGVEATGPGEPEQRRAPVPRGLVLWPSPDRRGPRPHPLPHHPRPMPTW